MKINQPSKIDLSQGSNFVSVDFQLLFESAPAACLILLPDDPVFTIVAVSDEYLKATMTVREEIVGQALFDVFPDNPDNPAANGVSQLQASLRRAIANLTPDRMALQRYDIPTETGEFEERYWRVLNKPAIADTSVMYVIHYVEDATETVRMERRHDELVETADQALTAKREADAELREVQRYRVVFAHAPVGIVITTTEGVVTEVNPAYLQMLGYDREELLAHDSSHFTHPEDISLTREFFKTLRTGHLSTALLEKRYIRKDGQTVWARAFGTVLRDGGGVPSHFLAIIEDITERKRAEEALALSEQKLQQVFAQAPVAIVVFRGRDFVIEMANPSYEALVRGRELVGRPFAEVVPELGPHVWDAFRRVLDTGEPFIANEWYIPYDQDGDGLIEDHWFNLVFHPMLGTDGRVTGVVTVCCDVTVQVCARKELEATNRNLEEFAYVASHDLQEPLRMVNVYTQLILRQLGGNNAAITQYAGFVQQGVARMEALIHDLLVLADTAEW